MLLGSGKYVDPSGGITGNIMLRNNRNAGLRGHINSPEPLIPDFMPGLPAARLGEGFLWDTVVDGLTALAGAS
jgi:hypothetical protein